MGQREKKKENGMKEPRNIFVELRKAYVICHC